MANGPYEPGEVVAQFPIIALVRPGIRLPARAGGADEFLMNFFLTDRDRAGNSNHAFSVRRVGFSGKRRFSPGPERIFMGHLVFI